MSYIARYTTPETFHLHIYLFSFSEYTYVFQTSEGNILESRYSIYLHYSSVNFLPFRSLPFPVLKFISREREKVYEIEFLLPSLKTEEVRS